MSRDSWQCLSVKNFFSDCNWQGQPLEKHNEQHQNQPVNLQQAQLTIARRDSWQCLSVQNFFSDCNWQGQPLKSRNAQHQPVNLQQAQARGTSRDSWQCLSVQHFFNNCNWQGQPLDKRNEYHINPPSRSQQPVKEFFQLIPWEGNPEIGSLPKISSMPVLISTPVEMRLTDLSKLF